MSVEKVRIEIEYDVFNSPKELPDDERNLLVQAREVMQKAYAPYSDFMVGAAIQLEDGTIVDGNNLENASYGLTNCAERVAFGKVGSLGRHCDVRKIAVVGTGRQFDTLKPVPPCGACRQVMREFEDLAGKPLRIIVSGMQGQIYAFDGIENLLPLGFGPKDLNLTPVP